MPKIVSQSIVSSSDQQEPQQSTLHVYYCLCSEFILVIDAELEKLPHRQTDNAYIISNARRIYKLTANEGDSVILKRKTGFEKQYRLYCPRCKLLIAYEMQERRKGGPYTYIVNGSLTPNQGSVPPGAIDI